MPNESADLPARSAAQPTFGLFPHGLSRSLLYDEMRRGNLAYVKVGRHRLITLQHLQQFHGIAS